MSRLAVVSCALLAALAAPAGLLGCGGSDDEPEREKAAAKEEGEEEGCESLPSEAQREECEKAEVAEVIPEADRAAYYVFATSNGLARGAAVAAQRGERAPIAGGVAELRAAAGRAAAAEPRDSVLVDVQPRVLRLLRSTSATGFGRSDASKALAEVRAIDRSLNRYLRRREPAQASLLPD